MFCAHCRLCGRSPTTDLKDPAYGLVFTRGPVWVALPNRESGVPAEQGLMCVCYDCELEERYRKQKRPFAIYLEQTDYSMCPVKTCPMCGNTGDAALGTFCWSCAGTMYRPSFKERKAIKAMAPLWDEYMRNESEREAHSRDGVNSVGALQVLPDSAAPPVWSYQIHPSGTQPDGTVTWSQHVEYVPDNQRYTRSLARVYRQSTGV